MSIGAGNTQSIEAIQEDRRIQRERVYELESALTKMTDLLTGTTKEQRGYSFYSWQRVYQMIEEIKVPSPAQGTPEPPSLRHAVLESIRELKHVAAHNIEPPFEVHAEALQICMEREAEKLELALAGPQNGQGWDEEHFGSVCSDYRHLAIERHKALGHEGEFERCVYEKCQRRKSATFGPAPPTGDAPTEKK